ncbi:MAG TPA: HD domain-containing protein [Pedobacter sp.]|nr:HD domain-containing protein [Pedobacter sp.]
MQINKNINIDEIQQIWDLVSKLHNGQKYGGAVENQQIEYINHIGGVAFEILAAIAHTENMNGDLAIKCALLHDTIEDTDFSYHATEELFGKEVADGVLALTKNTEIEGRAEKMTDSLQRIKQQPKEIWAVKMADRICNLSTIPYYWDKDKIEFYAREAQLICDELKAGNPYLAQRLQTKIQDYSAPGTLPI